MAVLILEGLPGAGKSTFGRMLMDTLVQKYHKGVVLIPEDYGYGCNPPKSDGDFRAFDEGKARFGEVMLEQFEYLLFDRSWISTSAYSVASHREHSGRTLVVR